MELLHIYAEIAIADPRGAEQRRRVGVPRRQGRAKIIPDGGATGVGLLAVTSDRRSLAAGSLAGAGNRCWRRARAACSVNPAGGVIRAGGST